MSPAEKPSTAFLFSSKTTIQIKRPDKETSPPAGPSRPPRPGRGAPARSGPAAPKLRRGAQNRRETRFERFDKHVRAGAPARNRQVTEISGRP